MGKTWTILTLLALFLTGLGHAAGRSDDGMTPSRQRRPGVILYEPNDEAAPLQKAVLGELLLKHRLQTERRLLGGKVRVARVLAASAGQSEEEVCAELRATGAVRFAEPDYLVGPSVLPNDPNFSSQWFHTKIGSPAAWEVVTGNDNVLVAVCDSGVQSTHPDLAGNLQLPGLNTVDNSTNTEPITSHGTQVAGCIGAIGNNATGVAGVCWRVKILPVRITNRTDGWAYYSDMAEGIRWAADQGAKVVNLSYGGAESYTIEAAARYLRSKGGLLFMSAGNDGADKSGVYPDFASIIVVGATGSTDTKTSWSNYGTFVDIVAPGSSIYTTTRNGYASVNGTSFASPIAAGVAALIFSLNPNFTPEQVENFIYSTCVDLGAPGDDPVYGHGRLNAAAAVAAAVGTLAANEPPTAVADAKPVSGFAPLEVTFDAGASFDRDGSVVQYSWDFGDGTSGVGVRTSHTYSSPGTYTAKLTVTDNRGATGSCTIAITVSPPPLHDVAVTAVVGPPSLAPGEKATFTVFVANLGDLSESFDVTVMIEPGCRLIGCQRVKDLPAKSSASLVYEWQAPSPDPTSDGSQKTYTIVAKAEAVPGETNVLNNTAATTILITNAPPQMVVDEITITARRKGKYIEATAYVKVEDEAGKGIVGAAVYGRWISPATAEQVAVTGSDGKAVFRYRVASKGGTFTFAVVNVTKEGYTYDTSSGESVTASATVRVRK